MYRAAAAAKAVAAMTSSSLAGMVPPAALASILPATLPTVVNIATPDIRSPMTPGSNENSSSALDQAMAATLASIEMPQAGKEEKENSNRKIIFIFVKDNN